jgi:hypothetical protein
MNTNELIRKASNGTITPQEVANVANALESGTGDEYRCLLILGRANAVRYRQLVERYLDRRDDPMLARLSLQVLCRYWGLASDYSEVLQKFIQKVDWDSEDDVRIMAISCCESIVAQKEHVDLLRLLYTIVCDPQEDSIAREAAYSALAISTGKAPSELPSPARFDIDTDIQEEVMKEIERRLAR